MIVDNEMIADFITANHEPSRDWPRQRLLEWIDWFRRDGRCAILTKADHLNEDNRAADVLIPVTFAPAKKK